MSVITQYYRVIKANSGQFTVDVEGMPVVCTAKKTLKKNDIMVGDFVVVSKESASPVILSVRKRKNMLIRPFIANIDTVVIVVALLPVIDYYLIDKLILNARRQGLEIIICLNKSDLKSIELSDELAFQYGADVDHIISVSAKDRDIEDLRKLLEKKLSCFAGQSAVGKSSLLNLLCPAEREIGDLSQKILRGKNTTTLSELFEIGDETYIADTPGFSLLDVHDIPLEELGLYYAEFLRYADDCKYRMCAHADEPDCAVKRAVNEGKISRERYLRYVEIYRELKKEKAYEKRNRYGKI